MPLKKGRINVLPNVSLKSMFKETVEVEQVIGDKVKVRFKKNEMCSCCSIQNICGKGEDLLTIDNPGVLLKKGDKIQLAIDNEKGFSASIITLLIPAVLFISSLIFFRDKGELFSFIISLGTVCVYYVIIKIALTKQKEKLNFRIIKKL